jgi:hypothetical protein
MPRELTVDFVKAHVRLPRIAIVVSSTVTRLGVRDGKAEVRVDPKTVIVKQESEMKPELVMAGPKRCGEVNAYIAVDGNRYFFSAQTGEALGGELRPIVPKKAVDQFSKL